MSDAEQDLFAHALRYSKAAEELRDIDAQLDALQDEIEQTKKARDDVRYRHNQAAKDFLSAAEKLARNV